MKKVWTDKKRWLFFGLPWTFTRYTLTEEKFLVDSGFLSKQQEEIRLYRILDISLKRSFLQRISGLGTIVCQTSDKTSPILEIKNIKNSTNVKELLSDIIEKERINKRVSSREFFSVDTDDCDEDL